MHSSTSTQEDWAKDQVLSLMPSVPAAPPPAPSGPVDVPGLRVPGPTLVTRNLLVQKLHWCNSDSTKAIRIGILFSITFATKKASFKVAIAGGIASFLKHH